MSRVRMVLALPFWLIGTAFQLLAVYIGGEPFAAIALDAFKKRTEGL